MNAEEFLYRLDDARERGNGQWMARCPAHDDRGPSLSIREGDDGRILIHCFAGCEAHSIAAAVGLELSDLFPEQLKTAPCKRPRFNPRDLLLAIQHEATVVGMAASRLSELSDDELARVSLAGYRIRTAVEMANVR